MSDPTNGVILNCSAVRRRAVRASCIRGDARAQVVKIGEGTFGEAFKGNGMVLKIVPMGNQHLKVIA
jgi:hypothetical protein